MNIFYILLSLFILAACQSTTDKQLTYALKSAGDNLPELEKVLKHYNNDPEKLEAARFLIANMPAHKGMDITAVFALRPIYDKHRAISEKQNWERSNIWKKETDEWWKKEQSKLPYHKLMQQQDIKQVNADWLIREIDRSFQAWKENVYAHNISFEDFCHYILPYRFAEGICMDNSRELFYKRHAGYFNDPKKDFREVTDSLHYLYSDLMHNNWTAISMPIYSAATFELVKRGSCDQRTWYNCLLMSALGMPVAIDFVPAWGNRTGGHSWNSLIVDGQTYPFEPFWDEDRWKYKRIYNNECFDLLWGKFRLPKVYRHTYEYHFEGPLNDTEVEREDIPLLFKNPFIKDVSGEYFQTADVEVKLTGQIPEKTNYCYLCVFGNREWIPVQWGKISNKQTALFKGMGKDIVYCPMFFKSGGLFPAGAAFILNQKGEQEELKCENRKTAITVRNYTSFFDVKEIEENKPRLSGSCLIGYQELTGTKGDTLYCITDSMDMWENQIRLSALATYRYLKLLPAKETIALCEISFFEDEAATKPIQNVQVLTKLATSGKEETVEMITDGLSATGFEAVFRNKAEKEEGFCFDLGTSQTIRSFSFIPYTENYLKEYSEIELYYWDQQWISGGTTKCNSDRNAATFYNIPAGTLYRIKSKFGNERIFIYKDGIIHWY